MSKVQISLMMAQDIGLVPEVELYRNTGKLLFWDTDRHITTEEYRAEKADIVRRYCVDEKNRLCEFERDVILEAVRKSAQMENK